MVGTGTALLISGLASAGAGVGGAAINARAQGKAADKQAEAIEKGIALQEKMYNQDRADFAPYRGLGAGAVGNLAYLSGINLPSESQPATSGAPLTKAATLESLGLQPTLGYPAKFDKQTNQVTDQLTQRFNDARLASGGQEVTISRQGRTIRVPSTLLPKALEQGWAQVQ